MIGQTLAHYQIESLLGAGGMSACGHAEPRPCEAEARRQRRFALGVPAVAPLALWRAEARMVCQTSEGGGPQRQ